MVRRLVTMIAAIVAAAQWAFPAAAEAAPSRIVAVGDLHGDYPAWIDIATAARLIGPDRKWAGGRTVLVQMGDVTDRGPDSLKIIRHLQQLQREASAAGGRVVVLLGNHEAMQVTGDYRYVDPGEYAAFADSNSADRRERAYAANRAAIEAWFRTREPALTPEEIKARWIGQTPLGKVEHNSAWAPAGELGQWAAGLPAVVKLGSTLFAHGGISATYALLPLDEINTRARAALAAGDAAPTAIVNDELGPLWYRGHVVASAAAARPAAETELAAALKAFGAKRLVIAHTPALHGVVTDFDGRLVRIDTGISRAYGGVLGWIEIRGDTVSTHLAERSAQ